MGSGKARRQHQSRVCASVLGLLLAACQPAENPNVTAECKFENCPRFGGGSSTDRSKSKDAGNHNSRGGEGCPGC
jgi:hypothetical protein